MGESHNVQLRSGWSTDTSPRAVVTASPIRCEGVDTTYAEVQRELFARAARCSRSSASRRATAWRMVVQRRPHVRRVLPRRAPIGRRARAAVDDADGSRIALGEIIADSGAEVVVLSVGRCRFGRSRSWRAAPSLRSVVVDGAAPSNSRRRRRPARGCWRTRRSPTATRSRSPATSVDSPGVLAVLLSGTTGTPKGVMHVHGNAPRPRSTPTAGRSCGSARTTAACRSPSCSSPTGSATRSRSRSPSAPPPSCARRRRRPRRSST